MAAKMLYMGDFDGSGDNPNYTRDFDAVVLKKGDDHVILDQTMFYPLGGGQPCDRGVLSWEGGSAQVIEVLKKGVVLHRLKGGMPEEGQPVHGVLDWKRRYGHMRMHTAQHLISAIIFNMNGASTVGNQIHADRSRVDVAPAKFSDEDISSIEKKCNELIEMNLPVRIYHEARSMLEATIEKNRVNLSLLPPSVKELRVIAIGDVDICPCAGTHAGSTGELGALRIIKKENKGMKKERITYVLE